MVLWASMMKVRAPGLREREGEKAKEEMELGDAGGGNDRLL